MNFFDNLEEKAKRDGIIKKVAGGIITDEKGRILLLKRKTNDFLGGIYELPSGNLEIGENIEKGLEREVKEETNLEISKIGMFVNSFDYLSNSGKRSRQFNFEIDIKEESEIFLTEHDEYKWMDIKEIENCNIITDEVKQTIYIYKYNKNIINL